LSVMGCLRMDGREKTKAPAASGVFIVILRGQRRDCVCELLCERGARTGSGESDLCIDGEGGQPLVVTSGAMIERRDVAERSRCGGDQVGRAESIARGIVAGSEQAERFGTDDEGFRGRAQDSLDAVALAAFFDQLDEAFALEFPQVVIDALPGHAQLARQTGGGVRVRKMSKELAATALKENGRAVCATDNFEVHDRRVSYRQFILSRHYFMSVIQAYFSAPSASALIAAHSFCSWLKRSNALAPTF
jgi:hypothetical protein